MRGVVRTIEEYEKLCKIVVDRIMWGGETEMFVSSDTGYSRSDLSETMCILKAAKRGDEEDIVARLQNATNPAPRNLVYAAYNCIGKEINPKVKEVLDKKEEAIRKAAEKNLEKGRLPKTNAETATGTTPLWAQAMLLNQAKQISQLDELMDAVIPKYARDIVESIEKLDTHLVQLINKLS